ncbi:hypothetical protein FEM48_Zijuj09G0231100 [Ziziphus jujuba var. spinosa]|uniref:Uncharacterized protein n=1 Tax=Ziziphus jujuba var. spinosa TaxID=714518 RepID=A0A978UVV0_ZIZJJ|nr:hypothetical protein FEM48_Zijuj09G0231100 [Ziziphus jujuba var. spinosa]
MLVVVSLEEFGLTEDMLATTIIEMRITILEDEVSLVVAGVLIDQFVKFIKWLDILVMFIIIGMLNRLGKVFHSQALLLEVLILGLSLLEHLTLQSGFSNNFLYNYNMRSPVMPKSTPGIVAPNLQSYGSMFGLYNPFSYGVSTPLGSSNNISGKVP